MAGSSARKFTLAKVMPTEEPANVPKPDGLFTRITKAVRRQPGGKPSGDGELRDLPIPLETYIAMAGNLEKTPVTEMSWKFMRDMVRTSDLLSLIVRTKTNETFRSGVTIEERFKSKCQSCGREFEEEKLICPYDDGEMIQPDYQQWKVLDKFVQVMNRFDESVLTVMREIDTDVHTGDNGWVYLDRDYWFGDDGKITNEEVRSIIRMDPNMMRLIMSRYGMGTSETGAFSYFCIEHRTEVHEFADKGEGHFCKCGKQLIPAWYCALTKAERLYYGPREIYHVKLYSNAQGYGVPPLMSCFMKVNALLRMDKFILEAYSMQRSPQELLILRGKRDSIHRGWEWMMQKARENPNMVYPLVLEGDDGSKTRVVEHETFALKPIEWEWTQMRQEYRSVVGAVFGVQPIFSSGAGMGGGGGGLANEGLQIAVTTLAIKQEQHVWDVFLEFLSNQLGTTDYKIALNPNEQEDEIRDLDVEQKRIQIAQTMVQLGYELELHQDAKGRMEFKYKEKPLQSAGAEGEDLIPQEDVVEQKEVPAVDDAQSPRSIAQERWNEERRLSTGPQVPTHYGDDTGFNAGLGLGELQFDDDIDMMKVCETCGGEAEVFDGVEKSYRDDRDHTLRVLSGGTPHCDMPGCKQSKDRLMIAHNRPDEFTGYASRSGGGAYSRWMTYVRQHPDNYRLLCPEHHSEVDHRKIAGPEVHRKDVKLLMAIAGKDLNDSYDRLTLRNNGIKLRPLKRDNYLVCGACGKEFSSYATGLDAYVEHVKEKHPEYVKKANYTSKPISIHRNPRGDEDCTPENVQGTMDLNLLEGHAGMTG